MVFYFFNYVAWADEKSNCDSLAECIQLVSSLTNKKYLIDKDVKGSARLSKNYQVTRENADGFISELLALNGYTRIPAVGGDWTVINARDVRYLPVKTYEYGKDQIPMNYDHVMVTIKLKNPYITSVISRNFRPFMSRYGRIIDIKEAGTIIISDTGLNANRLGELVKQMDREPTEAEIEQYKKDVRNAQRLSELRAKNCGDLKEDVNELKMMLYRK